MTDNSVYNVQEPDAYGYEYSCFEDCGTIHDFMKLTNEMTHTIIELEEELVRWRQALIKYLPGDLAEGLQQDILNSLSRDFEGEPAYDMYVNWWWGGHDPKQDEERIKRLYRIANGTDETSIKYL